MSEGEAAIGVSDLNRRIRELLERSLQPLWVRGEVSNLRKQASGHSYFSLKDEASQVSAVLFRGDAARSRSVLREGMQVVVFGEVSVYEPRGSYQLIVRLAVEDGVGNLRREFERLKAKLAEEGLFAPERKRELPEAACTVGFITSPDGAAAQDFVRILKRRGWKGRVVILPARVQGREAAAEMVSRTEWADRSGLFDLLVIGRGGGSLEDLWAFNEEILVRAVAATRTPVISAVGHEIDFTLVDFAADVRAETPSGAAELISSGFLGCIERLRRVETFFLDFLRQRFRLERHRLELLSGRLKYLSPDRVVERQHLRLDELGTRMGGAVRWEMEQKRRRWREAANQLKSCSPRHAVRLLRQRQGDLARRLVRASLAECREKNERLAQLARQLASLNPEATLKRGFALVRDEEGRVLSDQASVTPGQGLEIRFRDGPVRARAEGTQDSLPL